MGQRPLLWIPGRTGVVPIASVRAFWRSSARAVRDWRGLEDWTPWRGEAVVTFPTFLHYLEFMG
jgi:hypothetical protein